jgi:hypothetical protein
LHGRKAARQDAPGNIAGGEEQAPTTLLSIDGSTIETEHEPFVTAIEFAWYLEDRIGTDGGPEPVSLRAPAHPESGDRRRSPRVDQPAERLRVPGSRDGEQPVLERRRDPPMPRQHYGFLTHAAHGP